MIRLTTEVIDYHALTEAVRRPGCGGVVLFLGTVRDLTGDQVTVVNVFASWCIPCRDEHPVLEALKLESDVRLFGINQRDASDNAARFLSELGNPYDRIGADPDNRVSIDWGVYGVPETFVVNADGVITFKHVGPLSPEALEAELLPAIAKAKAG